MNANGLRLFYVHNIEMPGAEANTVHVAKMCNAFAACGCDVTLIAASGAGSGPLGQRIRDHYGLDCPFKVVALPKAATKPSLAALFSAASARLGKAELVYTRAPHVGLVTCALGMPTIFEMHADESAFSDVGKQALVRLTQHPRLVGVVTISNALAEHLRERFPTIANRLLVAHDGADARQLPPPAPRERLEIGYVGHLYRGRGIELILALAKNCPWADFSILGGSEVHIAQWSAAAPSNVRFLGSVPHAEVSQKIASFDIVLAPYQRSVIVADGRTDTARWMSPLKLFEYMAAAKPIVASDLPAIREVLTDGVTALLRPPDASGAWTNALIELRNDPSLRHSLAANARAELCAHYTWRRRAERILEALGAARTLVSAA